jgi:hypothetical protein
MVRSIYIITVASNLQHMFAQLVAVGNDIDRRGSVHTGSILVEQMMIAGCPAAFFEPLLLRTFAVPLTRQNGLLCCPAARPLESGASHVLGAQRGLPNVRIVLLQPSHPDGGDGTCHEAGSGGWLIWYWSNLKRQLPVTR